MKNIKSNYVIGTWSLSGDYGFVDVKKIIGVLEYCYSKKFIEFDTSPSYGNGKIEFILGDTFKNKKILINTKIGNIPFLGKSFKIDDLKKSFFSSLKRLNRENINILYLHNPRIDTKELYKCLKFLRNLKKQKLIKKTGISLARSFYYDNKTLSMFDIVQDEFNLLNNSCYKYLQKKKFIFYARSPFANGILNNKFNKNKIFLKNDHRSKWLNNKFRKESILTCIKRLKKLLNNKNLKSASLNFILNEKKISKTIFGVKKIEHVKYLENKISKKVETMNMKKINSLIDSNFNLSSEKKKYMY